MIVLVLTWLLGTTPEPSSAGAQKAFKAALAHFNRAQFAKAAEGFDRTLGMLEPNDQHTMIEQRTRELLVLALYDSGQHESAVAAYQMLLNRFPSFEFDRDQVLPETIDFFAKHGTRPPRHGAASLDSNAAATDADSQSVDQPKAGTQKVSIRPPEPADHEKGFRPEFLLPLGVGQLLAGSPVRASVFLTLEASLLATNIIAGLSYQAEQRADGFVQSKPRADAAQLVANIAFFALVGTATAALVDAIWFEP